MTLLQIAGGQTWPNFLPLLGYQPSKVVFLTSADPDGKFAADIDHLRAALRHAGQNADFVQIFTLGAQPTLVECRWTLENLAPADTSLINLTGGTDKLSLASDGPNSVTVTNVENIVGGSQDDVITLGSALTTNTINGGAGTDSLTLFAAAHTITLTNITGIETINIQAGFNDSLTLVNGMPTFEAGGPTGALPGVVVGPSAEPVRLAAE